MKMQESIEQDNAWTVNGRFYPNARDAFYARQEAERREADHIARASQWFANQLVGVVLRSERETYQMCRELAETRYGADRIAAMESVIRAAARLVWLAEVQRATTDPLPIPRVTEQPSRTVTYHVAAA